MSESTSNSHPTDCESAELPVTIAALADESATIGSNHTDAVRLPPTPCAVPDYEILEELGRGGMGVVYKARQSSLKRIVALKMVLAGSQASADDLARFRREAEAAAQLQHPNIVQVHEVGQQDDQPFFSLEYVEGGSLAQSIRGTPQSPASAARIIETLGRAVHFAHQAGIVHRDLKPGNVLLTTQGIPKITDFGLAKRLEGDAGQTKSGDIIGTPGYMAPEQAAGQTKSVGPQVDIYALGAILYELLTGHPPFKGESALETLMQVLEREPQRPRLINAAVPRDLETICLKAMAKDVRQRYQTASELAEDLDRFLQGRTIRARPVTQVERVWRWCRRNPVIAGLAACATSLLIIVAAMLANKANSERSLAPDGSLERVQQSGKLVIATDPTYPPMQFLQDGGLAGFDVDLARRLASRLHVQAEFVPVNWDWQGLAARLNAHDFDVLISSITVTDERQRLVDFVEYLRLSLVYVCREGVTVRSERDLAGKAIAVQTDTTAYKFVEQLRLQGVLIGRVIVVPGTEGPFEALKQGTADVTLAHEPVGRHYAKQDPRLTITGSVGHEMDPDPVGIAFSRQDKELQAAVADALKAMKQDGTFNRLLEAWFGR
jgi:serine/threonine protein kinase